VNGDDPELLAAVSGHQGLTIKFGFNETNDLFATDVRCSNSGVRFCLNNSRREVFVPMLGRHNACNALAAIAVARRMGLDEEQIIESLATARGPEMRLQRQELKGIILINDAYNANPNSMRAALETVRDLETPGRRIAVLGDMKELGPAGERYHREIGTVAAASKLDVLACVGKQAALIALTAEEAGMPVGAIAKFKDASAAAKEVPSWLRTGDLVLLKASRSVRLERIADAISQAFAVAAQNAGATGGNGFFRKVAS